MDSGRPLKTYGIYCTDLTLGRFGRGLVGHFFSTAFRTLFFSCFQRCFLILVPEWNPKWISSFPGKPLKSDPISQKRPRPQKGGSWVAPGHPNEGQGTKMDPGSPKIEVL